MQVDVKVNPCVEDVEVLITAEKKTQFVNDLVEVIWDFDLPDVHAGENTLCHRKISDGAGNPHADRKKRVAAQDGGKYPDQ